MDRVFAEREVLIGATPTILPDSMSDLPMFASGRASAAIKPDCVASDSVTPLLPILNRISSVSSTVFSEKLEPKLGTSNSEPTRNFALQLRRQTPERFSYIDRDSARA